MRTEALRKRLEDALLRLWFSRAPGLGQRVALALLSPVAALTRRIARRRRARIRKDPNPGNPAVIVIGNLIVGGTGKTPATIAIARELAARGWHTGLIAGGYRATRSDARIVPADGDAATHGDEAVLLAAESGLPVAAGRRRGEALALLTRAHPDLEVVLSDDGLQHPGLPRLLEVAVFDHRGAGNGRLLPAGPLREPLEAAARMDALLLNGGAPSPVAGPPAFRFDVVPAGFRKLEADLLSSCDDFRRRTRGRRVAALAGIGAPERFFASLRALSIDIEEHPLADHARIDRELLAGIDADIVVMTTKDAVKCRRIADDRCWVLEARARVPVEFITWIEEQLRGRTFA